ncbi:hypothetical protein FNF29_01530 [Cafeteria roenbergensis]|uniref:Cyclic nucleotide-binding domain-containing protein n=1 Tax=Cafeteria roenbergensis TaxID=33653 RepID=A0A5A8CRA9_CAFRO|nr:hypothetical protein FNF29_01530 [Cafeteria roenbergensis]|eukprot:KAA0155613.1 hypothetical protein FNF29_01530 [Cafeteria roenbergensis]
MQWVRMLSEAAGSPEGHGANTTAGGHGAGGDGFATDPTGGLLFVFVALILGALVRGFIKFIPIPYTVMLLVLGAIIGIIDHNVDMGALSDSIQLWVHINPHLIFYIFLPALIFGSAFSVDPHVFLWELSQMTVLATVGVGIATGLTALFTFYAMGDGLASHWATSLAFGAVLSATDPVAVVALLKDLGAPKQLSLLIEGESLFNDGTAMAVFLVFLDLMRGEAKTIGEMVLFLLQLAGGGILLGLGGGIVVATWMGIAKWDATTQVTITLFASYLLFIFAEGALEVSGVLAVVGLGLVLAVAGRTSIKDHAMMHYFWEMIEYIANTLVFVIAGLISVERGFLSSEIIIGWDDFGDLILLYIVINVVRAVTAFVLWPALNCCSRWRGYDLGWREMTVISWAGLRGAVGLVLSLLVAESTIAEEVPFSERTGQLFLFHMAGITALTLLINGSTTGIIVKYLGIGARSAPVAHMFSQAVKALEGACDTKKRKLKADEFFRNTDWTVVGESVTQVFRELDEQTAEVAENAMAAGKQKDVSVRGFCAFAFNLFINETSKRKRRRRRALRRCRQRVADSCCCVDPLEEGGACCLCCYPLWCSCCCCPRPACCGGDDPTSPGFGPSKSPAMRGLNGKDDPSDIQPAPLDHADTLDLAMAMPMEHKHGGRPATRQRGASTTTAPAKPPPARAGKAAPSATASVPAAATAKPPAPARAPVVRAMPGDAEECCDDVMDVHTPRSGNMSDDEGEDEADLSKCPEAVPRSALRPPRPAAAAPDSKAAERGPAAAELSIQRPARTPSPHESTPQVEMVDPRRTDGGGGGSGPHITLHDAGTRVKAAIHAQHVHHDPPERRIVLAASRQRYLSIIKSRYIEYFEKGRIGSRAFEVLTGAAAKCLDNVGLPLHEWDFVEQELKLSIVRWLTWRAKCENGVFKKVEFDYEVCAGFIFAHSNVITFLRMVVSDVAATDRLAAEELKMVTCAREYLEDSLQEHSITRAVQTRHAIRVLLTTVEKHAHHLHVHGEIDEKEFAKIVEAVHRGWDHPGFKNRMEIDDAQQLKEAAFFDELPGAVIDELVNGARSRIREYPAGAVMMKENEHASGVIIVVAGLVELRQHDPNADHSDRDDTCLAPRDPGAAAKRESLQRRSSVEGLAPGEHHIGSDGGSDAGDVAKGVSRHGRSSTRGTKNAIVVGRNSSFGITGTPLGRSGSSMRGSTIGVAGVHNTEPNLTSIIRAAAEASGKHAEGAGADTPKGAVAGAGSGKRRAPAFTLDASLRPVNADGSPVDIDRAFGRVIDTLSWGSVVGALSMLTGFRTQVTAVARTRVRAVILRQADIYTLLKSTPAPGLPFRRVKPLETALCKMAGVLVTELNKVRGFEGLSPGDVREVLAAARLLRPEAMTAAKIFGDILVLTGRVLKPIDTEKALYIATHLDSYKRGRVFGVTRRSAAAAAAARKAEARKRMGAKRSSDESDEEAGRDGLRRRGSKEDQAAGVGADGADKGSSADGKPTGGGGDDDDDDDDLDKDCDQFPEAFETDTVEDDEDTAADADSLGHFREAVHPTPSPLKPGAPLLPDGATSPAVSPAGAASLSSVTGVDAPASTAASAESEQHSPAPSAAGEPAGKEGAFDPEYARKQREQQRSARPRVFTVNGERFVVSLDDFETVSSTFTFLPHNPYIFRWFGEGTRLLCIPHGLLRAKRERVAQEGRQIRRTQAAKSMHARLAHMPEQERDRVARYLEAADSSMQSAVGGSAASLAAAAASAARSRKARKKSAGLAIDVRDPASSRPPTGRPSHRGQLRRDEMPIAPGSAGFTPTGASEFAASSDRTSPAGDATGNRIMAPRQDSMMWAADPRIIGESPRPAEVGEAQAGSGAQSGMLARAVGMFFGAIGRNADQAAPTEEPAPAPTSGSASRPTSGGSTPSVGIAVSARRSASEAQLATRAGRAEVAASRPPAAAPAGQSGPNSTGSSDMRDSPARLHGRVRRVGGDGHDPHAHGLHADEHGSIVASRHDSHDSLMGLAIGIDPQHVGQVGVAWHSADGGMHVADEFHTGEFETHDVDHHEHIGATGPPSEGSVDAPRGTAARGQPGAAAPGASAAAAAAEPAGTDPRKPNPHFQRLMHDNPSTRGGRARPHGRSPLADR